MPIYWTLGVDRGECDGRVVLVIVNYLLRLWRGRGGMEAGIQSSVAYWYLRGGDVDCVLHNSGDIIHDALVPATKVWAITQGTAAMTDEQIIYRI